MSNSVSKHMRTRKYSLLVAAMFGIITGGFGYQSQSHAFENLSVPAHKSVEIRSFAGPKIELLSIDTIPFPSAKPDFSKPHITRLLTYGDAPMPGVKPLTDSAAPMAPQQAALYRQIFELQSEAKWKDADELIKQLTDMRLRGHVLFQRLMHPTAYRASFEELRNWMALYNDHPNADKVYKLALARMPKDYRGHLNRPVKMSQIRKVLPGLKTSGEVFVSEKRRTHTQYDAINRLKRRIYNDISNGAPTRAFLKLRTDNAGKYLDATEFDRLQARIANSYMHAGKLDKALELAQNSVSRSDINAPLAGWVAGLVSWRYNDFASAARYFTISANSPYSSAWTQSAASFWASRSYMRAGQIREVEYWLQKAALHPRTFYGLIAARSLGWNVAFNWQMPEYREHHDKLLKSIKVARRAMALVETGQFHLADLELRRLNADKNPLLRESLIAYANKADLASLVMRLAEAYEHPSGHFYDAALFPVSPWNPEGGYNIDRALIHALIRQESRFNPAVESHSGAVGLMQVMPKTATYVAHDRRYARKNGNHLLKDPHLNVTIGQQYISDLMEQYYVDDELFSLLIAYNAGPGNLRRWKQQFEDMQHDPLLFIESIPMGETRAFLERVMANYWIYRMRFNQPTPSLNAVAEGRWAQYVSLDHIEYPVAKAQPATPPQQSLTGAVQQAKPDSHYKISYNR